MSTNNIVSIHSKQIPRTRKIKGPNPYVAVAESTRITKRKELYTNLQPDFTPIGDVHIPDSAKDSITYFESNKDKFEKVEVTKDKLASLPAGMIIVYTKNGMDGHIAVTNGNGQEMSDCTDNMKWLDAKGEGASFVVYKLTDNWSYDEKTKKLKFTAPQKS